MLELSEPLETCWTPFGRQTIANQLDDKSWECYGQSFDLREKRTIFHGNWRNWGRDRRLVHFGYQDLSHQEFCVTFGSVTFVKSLGISIIIHLYTDDVFMCFLWNMLIFQPVICNWKRVSHGTSSSHVWASGNSTGNLYLCASEEGPPLNGSKWPSFGGENDAFFHQIWGTPKTKRSLGAKNMSIVLLVWPKPSIHWSTCFRRRFLSLSFKGVKPRCGTGDARAVEVGARFATDWV